MSSAAESIAPMGVAATYFDGRTAAGTAVQLVPAGQRIEVRAGAEGAVIAEIDLARDQLFERFGFAPRQIVLVSGASVELPITVAGEAVLASAGAQPAPVARWQQRWPLVLAMLAGLLVAGVLGYLHALPRVVHWLAFQVPQPYVERLDRQVMAALERERLQPSRLSAERQAQIAERFAAAAARHAPDVRYSMVFRSMSGAAGINAFALPGGTIVVLDGLVELLGDNAVGNDRMLAVLGHELGHVAGRHSLRRLMQTTAVALGATVLWGDAAGLAANIPVLLSGLSFSRDMEREADDFSVGFLRSNGLSEAPLVGLFKEFERLNRGKEPPGFLSTHPSPKERQRRIEARSAERKHCGIGFLAFQVGMTARDHERCAVSVGASPIAPSSLSTAMEFSSKVDNVVGSNCRGLGGNWIRHQTSIPCRSRIHSSRDCSFVSPSH